MSVAQHLFAKSWDSLLEELRPNPDEVKRLDNAFSVVADAVKVVGAARLCGSAGKGTELSGRNEIDIVVIIPGLTAKTYASFVTHLHEVVTKSGKFTAINAAGPGDLSVRFKCDDIDVDLLPGAPLDEGPNFFLSLATPSDRQRLAASASPLQCDFIQSQGALFKEMVRVAKHWRKQRPDGWATKAQASYPSSYLLELFMLRAYQQTFSQLSSSNSAMAASPNREALEDKRDLIFRGFLELLASASPRTFLCWNAFYEESAVAQLMQDPSMKLKLLPYGPKPIVMDPVNPTANVANQIEDWLPLIAYANQALHMVATGAISGLQAKVQALETDMEKMQKKHEEQATSIARRVELGSSTEVVLPLKTLKQNTDPVTRNVTLMGIPLLVQAKIFKDENCPNDEYVQTCIDLLKSEPAFSFRVGWTLNIRKPASYKNGYVRRWGLYDEVKGQTTFKAPKDTTTGWWMHPTYYKRCDIWDTTEIVIQLRLLV